MKNLLIVLLIIGLLGAISTSGHKKLVGQLESARAEWALVEENHRAREQLVAHLISLLHGEKDLGSALEQVERAVSEVREIKKTHGGNQDYSILTTSPYDQAQQQVSVSVAALMNAAGTHARWSVDDGFKGLRKQVGENSDRLNLTYAKFNKAAQEYNRTLEELPSSLYARHLGFRAIPSVDGDLEVRGLAVEMKTQPGAPAAVSGPELRATQASANGLLVMMLDNGREAGTLSRINAITLPTQSGNLEEVGFNQQIGESMTTALIEVAKFMKVRHGGWPAGNRVEFGFADKYVFKDGPSAAVATGLIMDSLFTGKSNDDQFAVTGDMNSDGQVQPVGGVVAKIRGATKGRCSLVAVPAKNEPALVDLMVMDGAAAFIDIQVFTLRNFEEASQLAAVEKPAALREAIEDYAKVQELVKRNGAQVSAWLRNKFVLEKLQKVLQNAPNHASAKMLLLMANGHIPNTLSLAGSFEGVELAGNDLVAAITAGAPDEKHLIRNDALADNILKLKTMRAQLDARTRSYGDALISLGEAVREWQRNPPRSGPRMADMNGKISAALRQAVAERGLLLNNPTIIEELER